MKKIFKRILPQGVIDIYIAFCIIVEEYRVKVSGYKMIGSELGGIPDYIQINNPAQLRIGNNVCVCNGSKVWIHSKDEIEQINNEVKYDGRVVIEDNVHIGSNLKIDCYTALTIRKDCLLAANITILDSMHGMNPEIDGSYVLQSSNARPITIEEGVWIGENVTILGGSVIGKKSIIGAGAVVKGIIPSYSIAVGVPAKVIKKWNFESKQWDRVCD